MLTNVWNMTEGEEEIRYLCMMMGGVAAMYRGRRRGVVVVMVRRLERMESRGRGEAQCSSMSPRGRTNL